MTQKIWTDPDGRDFAALPRTWRNATNLTERWAVSHGWTFREVEVPETPVSRVYSKYYLHLALEKRGLYDTVWNALTEAQKSYWHDCNELSTADRFFSEALESLKEKLGIDDESLDEILEEARIDA